MRARLPQAHPRPAWRSCGAPSQILFAHERPGLAMTLTPLDDEAGDDGSRCRDDDCHEDSLTAGLDCYVTRITPQQSDVSTASAKDWAPPSGISRYHPAGIGR